MKPYLFRKGPMHSTKHLLFLQIMSQFISLSTGNQYRKSKRNLRLAPLRIDRTINRAILKRGDPKPEVFPSLLSKRAPGKALNKFPAEMRHFLHISPSLLVSLFKKVEIGVFGLCLLRWRDCPYYKLMFDNIGEELPIGGAGT